MNELRMRIEILVQGNVISKKTGELACECAEYLDEIFPRADEEKVAATVTHLAMAVQRIIEGGQAAELDENIWNEVKADSRFAVAENICNKIRELSFVEYPISEQQYLIMHICNMLS